MRIYDKTHDTFVTFSDEDASLLLASSSAYAKDKPAADDKATAPARRSTKAKADDGKEG